LKVVYGIRKLGIPALRKVPVPIVQENRYGLAEPLGSNYKVEAIVAIYIAQGDLQAAKRGGNHDGLPRARADLKSYGIPAFCSAVLAKLHRGEIGLIVAIKVRYREVRHRGHGYSARVRWVRNDHCRANEHDQAADERRKSDAHFPRPLAAQHSYPHGGELAFVGYDKSRPGLKNTTHR
jgi:hypothetical protein